MQQKTEFLFNLIIMDIGFHSIVLICYWIAVVLFCSSIVPFWCHVQLYSSSLVQVKIQKNFLEI